MLKDITLGQFIPGSSFFHRLDPRIKIVISIIFIIAVFLSDTLVDYMLCFIFAVISAALSKTPLKLLLSGLKPIIPVLIITAVLNMFFTPGITLWSFGIAEITKDGVAMAIKMVLRVILLVIETCLLTYTTSPILLTDAIESLLMPLTLIKLPIHELAMMMSIALRFIPTLIEETDKIINAKKARGADFESGNIFNRVKLYYPILIPLFASAFRRADELATAMDCRLYNGGKNRTRLRELKMVWIDYAAFGFSVAFLLCICLMGWKS